MSEKTELEYYTSPFGKQNILSCATSSMVPTLWWYEELRNALGKVDYPHQPGIT